MSARPTSWAVVAVLAWLFAGCIVVQVFLAGLGVFDASSAFVTHRNFGYLFGWLSLVLLIVTAVGRMPRRLIGLAALSLVQMALQSVLVLFREDTPVIAALHPVNGVLLLVTTLILGWRAWRGPEGAGAAIGTAS